MVLLAFSKGCSFLGGNATMLTKAYFLIAWPTSNLYRAVEVVEENKVTASIFSFHCSLAGSDLKIGIN